VLKILTLQTAKNGEIEAKKKLKTIWKHYLLSLRERSQQF